jgi:hypothetical protein
MKLLEFLRITESQLDESRIDVLQDKWSELLNTKASSDQQEKAFAVRTGGDVFSILLKADPSNNKQFLQWLIKLYMNGALRLEDAYKVSEPLVLFGKFKSKLPNERRDINRYKSIQELFVVVEPFEHQETKGQQDKAFAKIMHEKPNADMIYNDKDLKVVIPLNKKASCYHGVNTKWCTAAAEDGNNLFDYYNRKGSMYIILHKPSNRRWQLHFETSQYMDEKDSHIDLLALTQEIPKLRDVFGDKIDEAIVRMKPKNIIKLKNASNAIQHLAVELDPGLWDYYKNEETHSDEHTLASLGSHVWSIRKPRTFASGRRDDYEQNRKDSDSRHNKMSSDEEKEKRMDRSATIEETYGVDGLTSGLYMRILDTMHDIGKPLHYSKHDNLFILSSVEREEFVGDHLGDNAKYAMAIEEGSDNVEVDYTDNEDEAWGTLTKEEQTKIGEFYRNELAKENLITVDEHGDVFPYVEEGEDLDLDSGVAFTPSDYNNILWMMEEYPSIEDSEMKEDFVRTVYMAAIHGEEEGERDEIVEAFAEYALAINGEYNEDLDNDDIFSSLSEVTIVAKLPDTQYDDRKFQLMMNAEDMIRFASAAEQIGDDEYSTEEWKDMFSFDDLSEPHFGWGEGEFSKEAARASLVSEFWQHLRK